MNKNHSYGIIALAVIVVIVAAGIFLMPAGSRSRRRCSAQSLNCDMSQYKAGCGSDGSDRTRCACRDVERIERDGACALVMESTTGNQLFASWPSESRAANGRRSGRIWSPSST